MSRRADMMRCMDFLWSCVHIEACVGMRRRGVGHVAPTLYGSYAVPNTKSWRLNVSEMFFRELVASGVPSSLMKLMVKLP